MASAAPVDTMLALLAAAGSPLWHAAWDPSPPVVLPDVGGTALVAMIPLLAARHWWWPAAWAMAERALPLGAGARRLADLRMQAWFTAPVLTLAGAGLAVPAPHGKAGTRPAALAWLLSAWVLASMLAWGWMQAVRGRTARALCIAAGGPVLNACTRAPMRPCHWWWALLGLPLAPRALGRAVRTLAVAPMMLGLAVASVTLAWAHARPLWSAIWLLVAATSTGPELASRPGTPPADRAARWPISIVAGAALAWETLPR